MTIPAHPDSITPALVTAVLRDAGLLDAGAVTALSWQPIGTGQVGDSVRFTLAYDHAEAGPATIAGKFPAADPVSRGTAAMLGLYRTEVGFYRDLAAHLAVRAPRPLLAEVSEDGAAFVLLFEDLAPARGGNQLAGCSLADAQEAMRQAAAFHAPTSAAPALLERAWLASRPEVSAQLGAMYPNAQAVFRDRYADRLAPELMAVCEGLAALGGKWFGRAPPAAACLVHGDYRLDNMLFDVGSAAEPMAVLDWQTAQAGSGLTDIGYFLGCGVGSTLRRAHEGALLDLYCAEMTLRGVSTTRAAIWDAYCIGALHGVSTAVFSAAYVERTDRGDAMFLSMATGACELALDHGALAVLEASAC